MRALSNLFFLLLLCFTLSIVPLNMEIFDIQLPDINSTTDTPQTSTDDTEKTTTEYDFTIDVSTNVDGTNIFSTDDTFTYYITPKNMDVVVNDQALNETILNLSKASFSVSDMNDNVISEGTIDESLHADVTFENGDFTISLNLDPLKDILQSKAGEYTIQINYDSDQFEQNHVTFKVINHPDAIYTMSEQLPLPNTFYSMSYYYDPSLSVFLPVSVPTDFSATQNWIRYSFNQLYNGVDHLSDLEIYEPTVPYSNNILLIGNETAVVHLTSYDLELFSENIDKVIKSITETICQFDNISSVIYYIDGLPNQTLHGMDFSQVFVPQNASTVFLPYFDNGTLYLSRKIDAIAVSGGSDGIEEITKALQGENINVSEQCFFPLAGVNLNNYEIINNNGNNLLTVDFDSKLFDAYTYNYNYQKAMIDAIINSYTSLPNVDQIIITVDGKTIDSIDDYPITWPQEFKQYINPMQ